MNMDDYCPVNQDQLIFRRTKDTWHLNIFMPFGMRKRRRQPEGGCDLAMCGGEVAMLETHYTLEVCGGHALDTLYYYYNDVA